MTPRALDTSERIDWLRLARTESVGPASFRTLVRRFGGPGPALAALPEMARGAGRGAAPHIPSRDDAERELASGQALGARLLAACEPDFPWALAAVDPPPPVLWALGEAGLLKRDMVAIVGARSASAAGRRFAQDIAAALGDAGWVVVSGMARGIDSAAHRGALESGTIAVLAGGVDDIYPPENAELHDAIRVKGCVVSERPIGAGARAADFPRRNRIISGLSRGVVVVEAELRSGSLITARLAADQGREVFAVPGSPLDPRARGPNDLLRNGAVLVEDAQDVLAVLDSLPGFTEPAPEAFEPPPNRDEPGETALRADLESLLSPVPTPINVLARETGAPVSRIMAALSELEIAGRAELLPGGLVAAL